MAVALAMREQGTSGQRPARPPGRRRPAAARSRGARRRWSASRSSFVGTAEAQVAGLRRAGRRGGGAPPRRGGVPARAAPLAELPSASVTLPLPHLYSGKVRDIYAVGDDQLLMVTSDRLSAFDVVLDEPIPHKGRVLTAISAFWFEVLGDVAGSHLVSTDVADLPAGVADGRPRPGRADHAVPQGRDAPDRVHRARLPLRLGVEGVPGRAARCTARPCPAGLQESDQLPEPVFTPSTKSDVHDENISFERAVDLVGDGAGHQGPRHLARALRAGRRDGPRARDHHRRHQVRARARRRRARAVRRGADARLQPLLAASTSGSPASRRRASTSSRCATTSTASTGTRTRRRRRCPPRSSTRHERALHRGLRAHHRPLVRGLARRELSVRARPIRLGRMLFSVLVETRLRPGHRRPAGRHHRAVAAAPRLRRHPRRPGRQGHPLRARGPDEAERPGRGRRGVPAVPHQPGDRGRRRHAPRGRARLMAARVGVVLFPGSNCELDAVEAIRGARRRGRAAVARRRRRSGARRRGRPPRRLRPRRLPAARRHRPLLAR